MKENDGLSKLKKKAVLSRLTLMEVRLILRENLINININFIKYNTPFLNLGQNKKDTNETVVSNIKFALLSMSGCNISIS